MVRNWAGCSYEVNREWVRAQLERREGEREVGFVFADQGRRRGGVWVGVQYYVLGVGGKRGEKTKFTNQVSSSQVGKSARTKISISTSNRPAGPLTAGMKIEIHTTGPIMLDLRHMVSRIHGWNPHLTESDIKARLTERIPSGAVKRVDVDAYEVSTAWVCNELAKPDGKGKYGYGYGYGYIDLMLVNARLRNC